MATNIQVSQEDTVVDKSALRRVAGSVLVGTTIEWYDFQLYGASAALVFAPLFFSGVDPSLAIILSLRPSPWASSPAPWAESSSDTSVTAWAGKRSSSLHC